MANKTFRGDSVPIAKVVNITPVAPIIAGQIFAVWCNGKSAAYTAQSGDAVGSVVNGLAAAIAVAASSIPEFGEFTAAPSASGLYLVLTAATPGVPFDVTCTCSGNLVVSENTAGGPGVNEVHKLQLLGTYTGGTFTITYNFGSGNVTTGNIAYNATAATVQAALVALSGVGAGQVVVTGGAGPNNPWFATWSGTLGSQSITPGTINGASLTGNGSVTVVETQHGNGLSDEFQQIDPTNCTAPDLTAPSTYTLTLDGQTTAAIATNASAATIQTALAALSNVGTGNVEVLGDPAGGGPTYGAFVHFKGALAGVNVSQLVVGNWTGAGPAPIVTTLQDGGATSADDFQYETVAGANTQTTIYLTYQGKTTGVIALANSAGYSAAQGCQTALQNLSTIGAGNVTVYAQNGHISFNSSGFLIRFTGAKANTQASAITGAFGSCNVSRLEYGKANCSEIQTITVNGASGTFTLTAGAQTTSAIAWNASTATLQTRIQTDLSSTFTAVTVTGAGTPSNPYVVTVTNPANAATAVMTGNGAGLGGGGLISELTAGHAGTNEVQVITAAAGVSGGTFLLGFGGQVTEALPYNASSAQVQAALRDLSTINTVTVTGSAGGPWTVTWSGAQASTSEPLLFADGSQLTGMTSPLISLATATWSAGPMHYDDPNNWAPAGVPGALDAVHFDGGSTDCLYGLDQICTFTWATGPNLGTFTGKCALQNGQVVFVSSSNTLPTGLTAGTSYYVVGLNRDAGTFQLATTLGGTPVTVSSSGTGTHTIGARLMSIEASLRWSGSLGSPRINALGYCEYRTRYLHVGLATIAQTGLATVTIGTDQGQGSPKIQIDNDIDQVSWTVNQSGSSTDQDARAVALKGTNTSNTLNVLGGDVGTALFPTEIANLASVTERAGTLELGTGTTVTAAAGTNAVTQTGGTFISDGATINGPCVLT